ncbi:MAG: rane protein [Mycobacterium sp.]|nr:rane protein [Mycobacterium sp.]
MSTAGVVLVALTIAVGLAGIVIPVLPGGLLVFGAIAVWAWIEGTTVAWVTLGIVTVLFVLAAVIKYTWPVKRMRQADVRTTSLLAGGVLGVIGFFVVPVLGLVLGFILGVFLAELGVRRNSTRAWVSTVHALKGVALSVGVELLGALASTVVWICAVAFW